MESILDKKNRIKRDWSQFPPSRKTCQSCFNEYETNRKWSKRCPDCKKIDAPYRKQIINDKNTNSPFE